MKAVLLVWPYYFTHRDGRASTEDQLRLAATFERRETAGVRNARNLRLWRARFERDPLVNVKGIWDPYRPMEKT